MTATAEEWEQFYAVQEALRQNEVRRNFIQALRGWNAQMTAMQQARQRRQGQSNTGQGQSYNHPSHCRCGAITCGR